MKVLSRITALHGALPLRTAPSGTPARPDGMLDEVRTGRATMSRTLRTGAGRRSWVTLEPASWTSRPVWTLDCGGLEAAGARRRYEEQTSSVGQRTALADALAFCRGRDTFTVTKRNRSARGITDLWDPWNSWRRRASPSGSSTSAPIRRRAPASSCPSSGVGWREVYKAGEAAGGSGRGWPKRRPRAAPRRGSRRHEPERSRSRVSLPEG